jgi:DNA-binding CsgD family transcriptional regulator
MALLEREAFLGQLRRQLVDARRGRGSVALVVGEAGIGKTSLVAAFCAATTAPTRILWGTCDPIRPPRPFAPIVDIAGRVGGEIRHALAAGDRARVLDAFLFELRGRDAPTTIVVLDDLHWADDATLDLLQVVGRRVSRLPVLVIGTYRDHEVGPDHPLRLALGDVPAAAMQEVRLGPLSVAAVERLREGGVDARAVHAATGGNPFFVTEVLAGSWRGDEPVPTTVRDAVQARVVRLGSDAQAAARAAAVLGPGSAIGSVMDVAGVERRSIEECVAHGLLVAHEGAVSFRHELARLAVLDSLMPVEASALHRRALDVLRVSAPADWPRLARHAIAAGERAAIIELAPAAGRAAGRLGAHREAQSFFGAALDHAEALAPDERADLLERRAHELFLVDEVGPAVTLQEEALAIWRSLGDSVREGGCLTALSGLLWLAGGGDAAMTAASAAVARLETAAAGSPEHAWALAVLAQRELVAGGDDRATLRSATCALELAERLGDERVSVHALTTASVARIFLGEAGGWSSLEESVARARAASLPEESARAMVNLVETARDFRRLHDAERYVVDATRYLEDHDLALYDHILRSRVAALELDLGRWDQAQAHAEFLLQLAGVANPIRVRALTIRGLIRARRGESGAWDDLDLALSLMEVEPQDLLPLRAARAESAWIAGNDAQARSEASRGLALGARELFPWWWSELAFWAWLAGARGPLPHADDEPLWLRSAGRPADAAAAWAAIGAPYQEALALAETGDEAHLRRALRTFNALGARPLSKRVGASLRALGAKRIDRGPRAGTRSNPAQLTDRQVEVLGLLAGGFSNAEIAVRLVISPKTVDHHVSAVLLKLGMPNRAAAAGTAGGLGIPTTAKDGQAVGTR